MQQNAENKTTASENFALALVMKPSISKVEKNTKMLEDPILATLHWLPVRCTIDFKC